MHYHHIDCDGDRERDGEWWRTRSRKKEKDNLTSKYSINKRRGREEQ